MPAWWSTVLLFLLPLALAAQGGPEQESSGGDPLFATRHFTAKDGLPHRVVSAIAQDDRGFLWLGTPQGLARFDGHGFTYLTSADGLASDAVRDVVCDRSGMLIVGYTNGKLEVVDPISFKIHPFMRYIGGAQTEGAGAVSDIIRLDDGTIVFVQNNNLYWYAEVDDGLQQKSVECNGWVDQLRRDAQRQVWCSCHTKRVEEWPVELVRMELGQVDYSFGARETMRTEATVGVITDQGSDHYPLRPKHAEGIYALVLKDGPLHKSWWVPDTAVSSGIPMLSTKGLADTDVRDLFRLKLTEDLWLEGTRIRRMVEGDDPETAPVLLDLATVVPQARLGQIDVLRDRLGNLWVGGEFGLIQVNLRPDRFSRYLWNGNIERVGEHRIRGMHVQGDVLHVNTETSGYWVLDTRTGAARQIEEHGVLRGEIIGDGSGGFWRGHLRNILHHDDHGRLERSISMEGMAPSYFAIWSALLQDNGSLMLGLLRGLRVTDTQRDSSIIGASGSADLDQAWVAHLCKVQKGQVLASTNAGLFLVDEQGRMLERWWTGAEPSDPHHLPTDDIRYAYQDTTGQFWLATASWGLLRWDRSEGVLNTVGKAQGFPTSSIHAIMPDRRGHLWMPTDNGLVRYRHGTGKFKVYTTADGLSFDEFNRLAYAQGDDGRMYFGGLNGITAFHPDELLQPTAEQASPFVLKSVKVLREEDDRLEDLTALVLDGLGATMRTKDRFISIEMALLSYEDPSLLTYAWRIDNIDLDWNMQREPVLRLTALPYGDHLLRIKAQDAQGRWSDELQVPITRETPLHLRWWFIALFALVLAAGIVVLIRYREQQLRRMIRMRDRIATDLHDEVGSNLSSIVLFSTAVSKHTDTLPEFASGMLQRMKDNSKRAMESMNDIVWSVNSGHDSMEDLLDRMRAYAEPLCEAADITVEFDVDAGPLTRKLEMEQRKNLYLIFKEAVSNAVRHSSCSRITVSLRLVNGAIELVVGDDGIGLPAEASGGVSLGGNGLGNMARRATEIGGSVKVVANGSKGTRVEFRFLPREQ